MTNDIIEKLESTGNYKVIERLPMVEQYNAANPAVEIRKGVYVDVETTGLSHASDKVIVKNNLGQTTVYLRTAAVTW